jgi:hypothetical protein
VFPRAHQFPISAVFSGLAAKPRPAATYRSQDTISTAADVAQGAVLCGAGDVCAESGLY